MMQGWLNIGDKIVMSQVTYEVVWMFGKYVLFANNLKYHVFDDLDLLNEFVYKPKK